jgi:hypothetical protein
VLALVAVLALPPAASARAAAQTGQERVQSVVANAAVGGVVGAAWAVVTRRDLRAGIARGLAGGIVIGAGKQVAAARFSGAGLAGRQLAAVGVALIKLAGTDTLALVHPVGPLSLEVVPAASRRLRARVNLMEAGALAYYGLVARHADFDAGATLSAGAPVFRVPRGRLSLGDLDAAGLEQAGVILAAPPHELPSPGREFLVPHETIHVIQGDAVQELIALPMERALVREIFGVRLRGVELGGLGVLFELVVHSMVPYERRPWEREAYVLTGQRPPWEAP